MNKKLYYNNKFLLIFSHNLLLHVIVWWHLLEHLIFFLKQDIAAFLFDSDI